MKKESEYVKPNRAEIYLAQRAKQIKKWMDKNGYSTEYIALCIMADNDDPDYFSATNLCPINSPKKQIDCYTFHGVLKARRWHEKAED